MFPAFQMAGPAGKAAAGWVSTSRHRWMVSSNTASWSKPGHTCPGSLGQDLAPDHADDRGIGHLPGAADEHGWRVVTLSFEHERAAAHRLAGFGDQVEVLTPLCVRATLVTTAEQILRRYDAAD